MLGRVLFFGGEGLFFSFREGIKASSQASRSWSSWFVDLLSIAFDLNMKPRQLNDGQMNDSFKDQFMIYNGFCQNLAVYSTCLSIQNQFRINASQPRRYSKLSDSHSQLLKPISNSRIAGFSVASLSNLWARYQMLVPPLGCNDCQFHWSLRNKSTSEFQECLEDYQPAFFTQINAWKKTSIMVHNHFLQRYFFTKCPTAQVLPFLKSMLWMFFPAFPGSDPGFQAARGRSTSCVAQVMFQLIGESILQGRRRLGVGIQPSKQVGKIRNFWRLVDFNSSI